MLQKATEQYMQLQLATDHGARSFPEVTWAVPGDLL